MIKIEESFTYTDGHNYPHNHGISGIKWSFVRGRNEKKSHATATNKLYFFF